MQPEYPYETYAAQSADSQSNLPLRSIVNVVIAALIVLGLGLIVFSLLGYGSLTVQAPSNASVQVNGHTLARAGQRTRLRPGTYHIVIVSPRNQTIASDVQVGLTNATYKPQLKSRDPKALVSSVIGAYGLFGPPSVSDAAWFENDTWFAAIVGPSSATPIALHYTNGAWQIVYFPIGGQLHNDATSVPVEIGQYLNDKVATYANK